MMQVISFITSNWGMLTSILAALLTAASLITRMTDTPKDDQVVKKIASFVSFLKPKDQGGGVKAPLTTAKERQADADLFRKHDRK
jgi:hypothetical protein